MSEEFLTDLPVLGQVEFRSQGIKVVCKLRRARERTIKRNGQVDSEFKEWRGDSSAFLDDQAEISSSSKTN